MGKEKQKGAATTEPRGKVKNVASGETGWAQNAPAWGIWPI